jgi:His/Glu/Gln/Arg/opine family amino acid ABC transporter permease subunit
LQGMGISQYFALIGFGEIGWGWQFMAGIWLTVQISVCGYLVGLVLGLLGAWAKLSGNRFAFAVAESYTTIVRAVPELLLIILIYYTGTSALRDLLVSIGFGENIEVNAFGAAVGTLGFVQGAYTTEVFRGAILSVPKGQIEAAKAFGLSSVLRFRRILFPLMFHYALPGLSNLWLSILKDSSLISVVGFSELLFTGKTAAASTKHYFYFYFVTALAFLALTSLSNIVIRQIEHGTSRGVRLT